MASASSAPRALPSGPVRARGQVVLAVLANALLVGAATVLAAPRGHDALGPLLAVLGLGAGFGYALLRRGAAPSPLSVVARGGLASGLALGALLVAAEAWGGRLGFGSLLLPLLLGLVLAVLSPILALPFAPVIFAACRALRAPSHDGGPVLLAIAGLWGALAGLVAALVGGGSGVWLVVAAGLGLAGVGLRARGRLIEALRAARAGEDPELGVLDEAEAASLDDRAGALPLLRGSAPRSPAWLVRRRGGASYRAREARASIARVDASSAEAAGVLRAAFAGTWEDAPELAVLATWTALMGVLLGLLLAAGPLAA